MGLMATIFAMWTHWVYYLFPWVFLAYFAILLPLNVPMGLLAAILVMLAHWVFYLFSWASLDYFFYFYLFHFTFLSHFLIVGLLLRLGIFVEKWASTFSLLSL